MADREDDGGSKADIKRMIQQRQQRPPFHRMISWELGRAAAENGPAKPRKKRVICCVCYLRNDPVEFGK